MKKKGIILVILFMLLFGISNVKADYCEPQALKQLAKIVYMEIGGTEASNKEDTFFMRLTTASVILNNASTKNGNGWYEKLYNLTNSNYANYSTYKDRQFADIVPNYKKGEMLYISSLVLKGKYNIPKNIIGQASCACTLGAENCSGIDVGLEAYNCTAPGWAKEWTHVNTGSSDFDTYFAYSKYDSSISNNDVFGDAVISTEVSYYKQLAKNFELDNYSNFTVDNVCDIKGDTGNNTPNNNNNKDNNNNNDDDDTAFETCTNPDILKVIYFFTLIIDIVKIIIPIGLIIMGMIDFSKSVVTSDESIQKKNISLFVKRIIYAVLIFIVPWIIEVLIVSLGDLTEGVNYTDCLDNANSETIEAIENGTYNYSSGLNYERNEIADNRFNTLN